MSFTEHMTARIEAQIDTAVQQYEYLLNLGRILDAAAQHAVCMRLGRALGELQRRANRQAMEAAE